MILTQSCDCVSFGPGGVAVNILPCQGRDRRFESDPGRHLFAPYQVSVPLDVVYSLARRCQPISPVPARVGAIDSIPGTLQPLSATGEPEPSAGKRRNPSSPVVIPKWIPAAIPVAFGLAVRSTGSRSTARVDPCAAHGIDTLPAIMSSALLSSKLCRPRMNNNANLEGGAF